MKNVLFYFLFAIFISEIAYTSFLLFKYHGQTTIAFKGTNELNEILDRSPDSQYQSIAKEITVIDSITHEEIKQTIYIPKHREPVAIEQLWNEFHIELTYPKKIKESELIDIVLKVSHIDEDQEEPFELSASIREIGKIFYNPEEVIREKKEGLTNTWVWRQTFSTDTAIEVELYDHKSDLSFLPSIPIKIYRTSPQIFLKFMQENTWLSWFLGTLGTGILFLTKYFQPKGKQKKTKITSDENKP